MVFQPFCLLLFSPGRRALSRSPKVLPAPVSFSLNVPASAGSRCQRRAPLKGNYDNNKFKLYFADSGLLVAMLDNQAQDDLRANKIPQKLK